MAISTKQLRLALRHGWHGSVPAEWDTLVTYLGGILVAVGKPKETGITHWKSPNTEPYNYICYKRIPERGTCYKSFVNSV